MTELTLDNPISVEVTQEWMGIDTARITALGAVQPPRGSCIVVQLSGWWNCIFAGRIINYKIWRSPGEDYYTEIFAAAPQWFLTKQYVPQDYSYLIPGVTDNPREYIKQWLGGRYWRETTGLDWESGYLEEVPNWSEEYAHNFLQFNPARHTKWDALLAVCDKYNMGFYFKPKGAGSGLEDGIDFYEFWFRNTSWLRHLFNGYNLRLDPNQDVKSIEIYHDFTPDSNFNRVKAVGLEGGSSWSYIASEKEINFVAWGEVRPVEYVYQVPELNIDLAEQYAQEVLDRLQSRSPLINIRCRLKTSIRDRYWLPGLRLDLSEFSDILDKTYWRIYKVTHRWAAGEDPETIFYIAQFDDLSHPFVAEENPFRRLDESITNKIMSAIARNYPGALPHGLRESLSGPTSIKPVEILETYDDGTVKVKIIETGQEFDRVKLI